MIWLETCQEDTNVAKRWSGAVWSNRENHKGHGVLGVYPGHGSVPQKKGICLEMAVGKDDVLLTGFHKTAIGRPLYHKPASLVFIQALDGTYPLYGVLDTKLARPHVEQETSIA
jgi:hypothetical protein